MSRGAVDMTGLTTLAAENGFSHCAPANMAALVPLDEIRAMCEADRCGSRIGR